MYYVIKNNKTNNYINLNNSHNPYDVHLAYAKVFYLLEDAQEYKSRYPENNWSIHELIIDSKPL